MATATLIPAPAPRPQTRFTVEEYHRLLQAGIVTKLDRVELLCGFLVARPTINPPHATVLSLLMVPLITMVKGSHFVRVQSPVTLEPDSEPLPDFAIVVGSVSDYEDRHPGPAEIAIVIEVADTTLAANRTTKLQLYAENLLAEYWIVNIPERRVEVYIEPESNESSAYRVQRNYTIEMSVPITLAGNTIGSLPVRDIFPR